MTHKLFFILLLSCFITVEMQVQAWITPIGTEITEDEGFRASIHGSGTCFYYHTCVMITRPSDPLYNSFKVMNFLFHPDMDEESLRNSVPLRLNVQVVPISKAEMDVINESWDTIFTSENDPYWLILDPENPDAKIVLTYTPKMLWGGEAQSIRKSEMN